MGEVLAMELEEGGGVLDGEEGGVVEGVAAGGLGGLVLGLGCAAH
jgi:hypothetical protein